MPLIYLISGSRSLVDRPGGIDWVLADLKSRFRPEDTLITGNAAGPDRWSLGIAQDLGMPWYSYLPNGFIQSGWEKPTRRWDTGHGDPPGYGSPKWAWKARLLLRDRVMVGHVSVAHRRGQDAVAIGFLDPQSVTQGTAHTLGEAQNLGLPVIPLRYT